MVYYNGIITCCLLYIQTLLMMSYQPIFIADTWRVGNSVVAGRQASALHTDGGKQADTSAVREAPGIQSKFALCCNFLSLATTGFLDHLKMPTVGALSTKYLPSPFH